MTVGEYNGSASSMRSRPRSPSWPTTVVSLPPIAVLLAHVQRAGRPRGAHDLIIAATAATYDLMVVTSDPPGFEDLPGVTIRRRPE